MKARGKLIVFEGPDGVGKTTLSRAVAAELENRAIVHELIQLPGTRAGTFGRFVYDIHHEPKAFVIGDLDPTSLQLLHAAAHIDTIAQHILPALRAGRWVLLDRFWWSTMVYGRLRGVRPTSLRLLRQLAHVHWSATSPAVAFLVTRPGVGNATLTKAYQAHFRSLRDSYPRRQLVNDGSVQAAVETILADPHVGLMATSKRKRRLRAGKKAESTSGVVRLWLPPDPVKPSPVFDTYWKFAAERQEVLFRRLRDETPPWTADPVIRRYRFTNAYRAADRVSQYLIREVIYRRNWSPRDLLFRIMLFKLFNKIETWELLERRLGSVDTSTFSPRTYSRVLRHAKDRGIAIYSAAYIMASAKSAFGHDLKHDNHLDLLQRMLDDDLPARVQDAKSLQALFGLLVSYPGLGPFLAFQYAIDINYSSLTDFDEMSFVVPGPGARDGIAKCFRSLGGLNETEIIQWMADRQAAEFDRLGLEFKRLGDRPLQLIDCQNLFCEVDKYARVAHPNHAGRSGRTRIKQVFAARDEPLSLWFPPKWKINQFFGSEPIQSGDSNGSLFEPNCERDLVVGSKSAVLPR